MAYLLYFSVIALNVICVLGKTKSKLVAIYSLAALTLVMGYAGTLSGDLRTYSECYLSSDFLFTGFESGYIAINLFFRELGLDFEQFRIIIFLICSVFIMLAIRGITNNYNMVILLYTLVMFYFLSVAIRFFIAFAIAVFALSLLIKGKKKNIIIGILLILLAAQFHRSAYVILLYLVCVLPTKMLSGVNKVLTVASLFSVMIGVFLIVFPGSISSISNVVSDMVAGVFNEDVGEMSNSYLDGGYSRLHIVYLIFYLYSCVISLLVARTVSNEEKISKVTYEKYKSIALLGLSAAFLVLVSQTFIRLLFLPLFMGFILLAKACEDDKANPTVLKVGRYDLSMGIRNTLIITTSLTWFVMLYIVGDLSFNLMRFLANNKL